jgi:hypothetical protein
MPVDVPQGWPKIGLGLVLMALAVLIYFINRVASAFLGTGNRYKRLQRIGAGLLIALGFCMLIVGVVHML